MKILCFGITRDIIGKFEYEIALENGSTIGALRAKLTEAFPDFQRLSSLRIALNAEYVDDYAILHENDEVVLIPPVSGG